MEPARRRLLRVESRPDTPGRGPEDDWQDDDGRQGAEAEHPQVTVRPERPGGGTNQTQGEEDLGRPDEALVHAASLSQPPDHNPLFDMIADRGSGCRSARYLRQMSASDRSRANPRTAASGPAVRIGFPVAMPVHDLPFAVPPGTTAPPTGRQDHAGAVGAGQSGGASPRRRRQPATTPPLEHHASPAQAPRRGQHRRRPRAGRLVLVPRRARGVAPCPLRRRPQRQQREERPAKQL